MNSEVLLRSDQIVKHFGLTHALNGISVEVKRGEVVGLVPVNLPFPLLCQVSIPRLPAHWN